MSEPSDDPLTEPPPRLPGKVRLALAQIAPALGDLTRNLKLHQEQIHRAQDQGADLVLFPELSLTGYFLRDMVPDVAQPADSALLAQLLLAAGETSVAVGFVERSPGNLFYHSALYAERGRVRHVHRKVYLPTYGMFDEQRYFARGNRIQAFDTEVLGRVGLLVCEDLWHLSAAVILQADEIDVLICLSNSPARGVQGPRLKTADTYDLLTRTYAQTLGVAVVMVNRVGYEDGMCFWGGSRVVGPDGTVIAEAPLLDPALLTVPFDLAELRRERTVSPLGRDERLLLTIEELQRIKRRKFQ